MKLSFTGVLSDGEVFVDADTRETDRQNRQAVEPVRLREGAGPLSAAYRKKLLDRFFDYKNPGSKSKMLQEVGVPDDEIKKLSSGDLGSAWDVYEERLMALRESKWNSKDKDE